MGRWVTKWCLAHFLYKGLYSVNYYLLVKEEELFLELGLEIVVLLVYVVETYG